MAGHIGVQSPDGYDTNGDPASLSHSMITGLLKKGLAFRGIVVSDALNMRAVDAYDVPALHALRAGCDMVLMPDDESTVIDKVRYEIGYDESFRQQILESARKVIRLKLTLGLYNKMKLEKMVRFDDIY
jgi:beta-N-acetylhexosaminidase